LNYDDQILQYIVMLFTEKMFFFLLLLFL